MAKLKNICENIGLTIIVELLNVNRERATTQTYDSTYNHLIKITYFNIISSQTVRETSEFYIKYQYEIEPES